MISKRKQPANCRRIATFYPTDRCWDWNSEKEEVEDAEFLSVKKCSNLVCSSLDSIPVDRISIKKSKCP